MTVPGIDSWLAAAFLGLAAYAALAREPELLMPEMNQRPWSGALARFRDLGDRMRGRAGIWGRDDNDGDRFVRDLRGDESGEAYERLSPLPVVGFPGVFTVELPFTVGRPREYQPGEQRPPWAPEPEASSEEPQLKDFVQDGPRTWQSGDRHDPPTLVRGMRAIMADDPEGIGHYVDGLPKYED